MLAEQSFLIRKSLFKQGHRFVGLASLQIDRSEIVSRGQSVRMFGVDFTIAIRPGEFVKRNGLTCFPLVLVYGRYIVSVASSLRVGSPQDPFPVGKIPLVRGNRFFDASIRLIRDR